jgi:phosphate-selective porin OprO/OprP
MVISGDMGRWYGTSKVEWFSTLRPSTRFGRGGDGIGAFELVARYSKADFNDRGLTGGEFSRWSLGLTWYPNRSWRAMANYGKSKLDRFSTSGNTDFLQFRMQWQL